MKQDDRLGYVNTFFGIDGGGNCLCGPYMPLGLARPGPDTAPPHPTSGYRTGDPVAHFAQTHVSGTGGGGRYGNIGLIPYSGRRVHHLEPRAIRDERGEVGHYACTLLPDGERVDLTCSSRAALYAFAYPESRVARLRIDLGAVIQVEVSGREFLGECVGTSTGGFVEILSPHEVIGRADLRGGWGTRHPYSVFFYLRLDRPMEGFWTIGASGPTTSRFLDGPSLQADLTLGNVERVAVQVGVSFVSVAQARASVERELAGKTFDQVKSEHQEAWRDVFARIRTEGGTEEDQRLFHSCFYRLYCMPTDRGVDDELERWKSGVRHFSEFYCLWDSIRNANSLFALIDPDLHRDMLNSLLDTADHVGWLPDAWIASRIAHAQGGSGADILFAEAALKGFDGIDYAKALTFMRKNAEVDSPEPTLCGRIGRAEYAANGFLRDGTISCVSRGIEYAGQDLAAAILAGRLGQDDLARRCAEDSRRIWGLWHEGKRALCPQKQDGSWIEPFDPTRPTRPDYWNCPYFYEGTAVEWTLSLRHDIHGLIGRFGGPEAFEAFLDRFFDGQIHLWKEIILHTPYLYHYVGKPGKSCQAARKMLRAKYHCGRRGLSDNDDMSSNSAYVICTMLGLYPEMGRDFYYLIAPLFPRSEIHVGRGKPLTLLADGAAEDTCFIRSVMLNGAPLRRAWVRHAEIADGGTLEFVLSRTPTSFGETIPPNGLEYAPSDDAATPPALRR